MSIKWSIPELIRDMRDEAKSLTSDDERKEINGDLIKAVASIQVYADHLEDIWKNREDLLINLLYEFRRKNFCAIDCRDCEGHGRECHAIRNVMHLVGTGELLKEGDL